MKLRIDNEKRMIVLPDGTQIRDAAYDTLAKAVGGPDRLAAVLKNVRLARRGADGNVELCVDMPSQITTAHKALTHVPVIEKMGELFTFLQSLAACPPKHRSRGLRRRPIIARNVPKRNAPCPCGSGLKYKRCHMSKRERAAI